MEYIRYNTTVPAPACDVSACPLAMAYVPMQQWRQLYDPNVGFGRGTIFMELDKPFCGKEGCKL